MRLAVFTSEYPARVTTFFERDMRALLDAGIDVEIFACRPLDPDAWRYSIALDDESILPRSSIHHLRLPHGVGHAARAVARRPATALPLAAASLASAARYGALPFARTACALAKGAGWAHTIQAASFDHVMGYWGNYPATSALLFHRLATPDVPFSIWLHASTDLFRTPVFMRRKLAYADNIITCCDFNRSYIVGRFANHVPGLEKRIHVSHHGLDLADFPFVPEGRESHRVIAVGRMCKGKGFEFLLRAARLLIARGDDVTVELVGDGDERDSLQRLATHLGIADSVVFPGWLPFAEVRGAMSRAALLVHPSTGPGDGLPNVIREAMAVGTPVIGSNVAGIPDALAGGCGVLVPPCDEVALAKAMGRLLRDADGRRAIAVRARRRVEADYDLRRNGERLARLLWRTRRGRPTRALDDAHQTGSPLARSA